MITLTAAGAQKSAEFLGGPFSYPAACARVISAYRTERAPNHVFVCAEKGDKNWPKVTVTGLPK